METMEVPTSLPTASIQVPLLRDVGGAMELHANNGLPLLPLLTWELPLFTPEWTIPLLPRKHQRSSQSLHRNDGSS